MLKLNIKLAIRNLLHKRIYTMINFTGLVVASAFAILIYLYVKHEKSYDTFHARGKNIYRLEMSDMFGLQDDKPSKSFFSFLSPRSEVRNHIYMPTIFPELLMPMFPEIKSFVRMKNSYGVVMRNNDQSYKIKDGSLAFAEDNFFSVFSYPLVSGDPKTALDRPDAIVINETTAKKYFRDENPVGKTIQMERPFNKPFMVTAVVKDFPVHSSMQFEMVVPLRANPGFERSRQREDLNYPVLLELHDKTDVADFSEKLDAFCKNYYAQSLKEMAENDKNISPASFSAMLRPLADIHYNKSEGWYHYTDLNKIYQLILLTILILLIVCTNYILLTLSNTAARSQEIGIRKTIGAQRRQIVAQFWTETQLLVILSVCTGLVLAKAAIPFFNTLTGASIEFGMISDWNIGMMMILLAVALGFIAGIYPAMVLSGLKPLKIMRSRATYKLNPVLSRMFVVLQYATCIVLLVLSIVVARQMKFMLNMDLGFDKEQVVLIENPHGYDKEKAVTQRKQFYDFAAADPGIEDATTATFRYSDGNNSNSHTINGKRVMTTELGVDYNFFAFNKIPIVKGRSFSPAFVSDTVNFEIPAELRDSLSSSTNRAIVVNETLYNMLGQPPMNEINKPMGSRIVGVCADYHFEGLDKKIEPAYHICSPDANSYYWCRIKAGQNIPQVMDRIHSSWNKITNKSSFEYAFMDENVQQVYAANDRWMKTITLFSWLAVFIACLGFFGLSGINTLNRTKEIGIRKIMGAGTGRIMLILNKEFIRMIVIALVIALPLAGYFATQWLDNFAYRIKVDWTIYGWTILVGLVSAGIAVSYHTIKAATADPAESLRTE